MVVKFQHQPETILFVVDLDAEMASEALRGYSRLQAVAGAINMFTAAKHRLCPAHRFGLVLLTDQVQLHPGGITQHPGVLEAQLAALAPSPRSYNSFALSDVVTAVTPLLAAERQKGQLGRVVLLYGRSTTPPAPVDVSAAGSVSGCPLDLVYVHDKPSKEDTSIQTVYSGLEGQVDALAASAGHAAYIYEAVGTNLRKLFNIMSLLLAHPLQRRTQANMAPSVDLAAAPLQPLPSQAAAGTASPPAQPTPAAPWSMAGSAAGAAAAAGPLPLVHVPQAVASGMNYSAAAATGAQDRGAWDTPAAPVPSVSIFDWPQAASALPASASTSAAEGGGGDYWQQLDAGLAGQPVAGSSMSPSTAAAGAGASSSWWGTGAPGSTAAADSAAHSDWATAGPSSQTVMGHPVAATGAAAAAATTGYPVLGSPVAAGPGRSGGPVSHPMALSPPQGQAAAGGSRASSPYSAGSVSPTSEAADDWWHSHKGKR